MKKILLLFYLLLLCVSCQDIFEENIKNDRVKMFAPRGIINVGTVNFAWQDLTGAEKYRVVIVHPSFDSIKSYICDTTVLENHFKFQRLPLGNYEWSIQAENFGYLSLLSFASFQIVDR